MLSVRPEKLGDVLARFAARDLACAVIGEVDDTRTLVLRQGGERELLWDLTATPSSARRDADAGRHAHA